MCKGEQALKTYMTCQENKFGIFMELMILQKSKQGNI